MSGDGGGQLYSDEYCSRYWSGIELGALKVHDQSWSFRMQELQIDDKKVGEAYYYYYYY